MSVFEVRYFTSGWGVQTADVDHITATSVTLPPLGQGDLAIATRIDGDRQQNWWDGAAWRSGYPPARAAIERREDDRAAKKAAATEWLAANRDDLSSRATAVVNGRPALNLQDVMYPSERLRAWVADTLPDMGAPAGAEAVLLASARDWIRC